MAKRREGTPFIAHVRGQTQSSKNAHVLPMRGSMHPSESGLGFTSIKARDEWKRRQARLCAPGLAPDEMPINGDRDKLEVTLNYVVKPSAYTRQTLESLRRRANFEDLQEQARRSDNFLDMSSRLNRREDQYHLWRGVEGPSQTWCKETTRLDNRQQLLDLWQPKLDAKFNASERMDKPVPEDRVPFWHTKDTFVANPAHKSRYELLAKRRTQFILDNYSKYACAVTECQPCTATAFFAFSPSPPNPSSRPHLVLPNTVRVRADSTKLPVDACSRDTRCCTTHLATVLIGDLIVDIYRRVSAAPHNPRTSHMPKQRA
jgi:hypothetical protein